MWLYYTVHAFLLVYVHVGQSAGKPLWGHKLGPAFRTLASSRVSTSTPAPIHGGQAFNLPWWIRSLLLFPLYAALPRAGQVLRCPQGCRHLGSWLFGPGMPVKVPALHKIHFVILGHSLRVEIFCGGPGHRHPAGLEEKREVVMMLRRLLGKVDDGRSAALAACRPAGGCDVRQDGLVEGYVKHGSKQHMVSSSRGRGGQRAAAGCGQARVRKHTYLPPCQRGWQRRRVAHRQPQVLGR